MTGASTTTRTMDPTLGVLTQKLNMRMRATFGEAAADAKGKDTISREVVGLMRRVGSQGIKEEDLVELESRIRSKLTGGTPMKMTVAMEKRAQVEGDQWGKIFQYSIQKGLAQQRAEEQAARERKVGLKQQLDAQVLELEARKRAERGEEIAYYQSEQASLRAWEVREQAKRDQQALIMRRLGHDRVEQLKDKEMRKARALRSVRDEEADLAARMAYMTLTELNNEEAQQTVAKTQLKALLNGNEMGKQMREEARRKQADEDAEFQRQWEAQLNKQEADRKRLVDKLKVKQDLQAVTAAGRPECKRWIDPAVIERHYREREEAREREEQERKMRVKERETGAVLVLNRQVKEREEAKQQEVLREQAAARVVLERVSREEQLERERQQRAQDAKAKVRLDLETQMKDNARRRRVAPMTEVEQKINTQLLEEVSEWQRTRTIVQ